jgi:hypothetical protein
MAALPCQPTHISGGTMVKLKALGGGTFNGCPPRYTIQDGVCKPYRGY